MEMSNQSHKGIPWDLSNRLANETKNQPQASMLRQVADAALITSAPCSYATRGDPTFGKRIVGANFFFEVGTSISYRYFTKRPKNKKSSNHTLELRHVDGSFSPHLKRAHL